MVGIIDPRFLVEIVLFAIAGALLLKLAVYWSQVRRGRSISMRALSSKPTVLCMVRSPAGGTCAHERALNLETFAIGGSLAEGGIVITVGTQ